MEHNQSELTVITKAKDLCSYVMTITQKSPKQFRFTFTSRLQNLSLDVIEALYRANDTFVAKENVSAREKRLEFQHQAMTDLKLLPDIAEEGMRFARMLDNQVRTLKKGNKIRRSCNLAMN